MRPMSEKPTLFTKRQTILVIQQANGRYDCVQMKADINGKVELQSMLWGTYRGLWEEMTKHFGPDVVPTGWRYLNEKVAVEWKFVSNGSCYFKTPLVTLQISNEGEKYSWRIVLNGGTRTITLAVGMAKTLEKAQSEIIARYNANIANLPEAV